MRIIAQIVSYLMLVGVVLAPILFFAGAISLDRAKLLMLIVTIGWFIATPLWMGRTAETPAASAAE